MGEPSVKQIVERCQQGDRKAFGQLYTLMSDNLRNVCRRYVSDEDTVDDLLHDAFLLIFTKIGSLKDPAKAEAWMQKVVQNLALTYVKQAKQQAAISLDSLKETPTIAAHSPVEYDEIMSLVEQLPQSYQKVFRLSVLEGMSHQDIARMLHIDPHTSSSDLFRAKMMLRRSLAVLLLGLLAVGLPIGLWHLLQTSPKQEPTITEAKKKQQPETEQSQETEVSKETVMTPETSPQVSLQTLAQQKVVTDSLHTPITPAPVSEVVVTDSTDHQKEAPVSTPTPRETTPRNVIVETRDIPVRAGTDSRDWTLAMAFSGISGRQSFNLPAGSYDPNEQEMDTITRHRLPLTFGLSVNKMIGNRWSIGSGLQYTQLYSETQAGNTFAWVQQTQRLHYLGIPLRAAWYPVRNNRWAVYTSAQAMMEIPIGSSCQENTTVNGNLISTKELKLDPKIQWSIGLGVGLEYRLSPVIGLYAEPSLNYFFKPGDGLDTYRTAHPATFSVPIGIRINLPTP
ncbi:MAG: sigma-70 family RNA polymerase sigma factor [Prevotella sp.]|nr:sigma-70 family RNA polymerase sigma factor [Prevotella sp.]